MAEWSAFALFSMFNPGIEVQKQNQAAFYHFVNMQHIHDH
jgi:hypothetical protein